MKFCHPAFGCDCDEGQREMTEREMSQVSDVLGHSSDWMLGLISRNPAAVAELAANELLVRKVKRGRSDA